MNNLLYAFALMMILLELVIGFFIFATKPSKQVKIFTICMLFVYTCGIIYGTSDLISKYNV